MDMGVATDLGSFGIFIAAWVPMMAAMMLPGAVPTVMKRARSMTARSVPLFVAAYVAVWAAVGIAVYLLYRPHGTVVAGVLIVLAGGYELTPLKARCRRRCQTVIGSGEFSLACVGSSLGLMIAFVGLGLMSVIWMVITTVVLLVQKVLPAQRAVDVAVASAIVALGVVVLAAPGSIPALTPAM
jgi:predicted metal-binding membrane protein